MQEILLEWQSPEHRFERKSADWYWILGILCAGASFLCFYFDNYPFGIFIIISGLTIGLLSYKDTKVSEIRVTKKGISFGKRLYPWSSYNMFWIEEEHIHGPHILIHPISQILPLVSIPISEEVNLEDLQEILSLFLEEEYLQESIFHKWFDKIISF